MVCGRARDGFGESEQAGEILGDDWTELAALYLEMDIARVRERFDAERMLAERLEERYVSELERLIGHGRDGRREEQGSKVSGNSAVKRPFLTLGREPI